MRWLIKLALISVALMAAPAWAQSGPGVSGSIASGLSSFAVPGSSGAAGSTGQLQYNNSGSLAGTNGGGDCTWSAPSTFTCTKTNGVSFGPFATGTNASSLTGTLQATQEPAHTGDMTNSAGSLATTVNTVQGGKTPVNTANGINSLSAATGSYAMGGNRLTGLAIDTTTGDALSRGQSSLNSLTAPTAAFSMNSQTLQSTAAAVASGQPLVGGVNNTVTGTQVGSLMINGVSGTLDMTTNPATLSATNLNGDLNVTSYGAKADDQPGLKNGALTGSTFVRSDGGSFVSTDVGKSIEIAGAGANFNALETTISAFTNSTTVTTAASATQNVSGKDWSYGTNNSTAFQSCLTAAGLAGKDCYAPAGKWYLSTPVYSGNAAGEIVQLVSQTIGTGDGVTKTFSATLSTSSTNSALCTAAGHTTPCTAAILRDSVFLSEENIPANTGRVVFVDEDNNGLGVFNGPAGLSTPGAVNYTTGVISSTINSLCTGSTLPLGCCTGAGTGTCGSAGFATAPASGAAIVVNYYLVPNANQPNQIYGSTGAAGFNGAGSAATQIDCGPSIKSYCLRASGVSGKTFRNFSMQSDFNIFSSPGNATDGNQMAFGGALFAIDGGAPSATNRFKSIETDYFQMVGINLDLQNDSTIQGVYATGMAFSNSYSIFANGNGGPEHLEDIKADHPVDMAGQQVGIYNSGLYGGLRLFSSDVDYVTVQTAQIWADTISGCSITTLTGVTNQGVAAGLDLDNVQMSPVEGSGAVCGHWLDGGHWKNVQFIHGPAFNLTQGPGNANVPYFEIMGGGGIGGNGRLSFTNASNVPAKIKWCSDGTQLCSYNYDPLSGTGTTFAGIGTPAVPTVTQLGTPGVGTCTYFQVDVGRNGLDSAPSAQAQITNCSASLATNNVRICPAFNAGATSYKILKTNTSTQLGAIDAGGGVPFSTAGCFLDSGQGTSVYTPVVDKTGTTTFGNNAHIVSSLGTAALPSISACGSGVASATSTDTAWDVTNTGTTCTITFTAPFANKPSCWATDQTAGRALQITYSGSGSITVLGLASADEINGGCIGK